MHMRIARYRRTPGADVNEIRRRIETGLVPLIRQQPGFRAFWSVTGDDDSGMGITVCEDKAALDAVLTHTIPWTSNNLRDLLPTPPEVRTGQVRHHALASGWDRDASAEGQPLHCTVREYEGMEGDPERIVAIIREHTVPIITRSPGFRAHFTFFDEHDPHPGVGVVLFASREEADRSHEQVVAAMRANSIAAKPLRVMAGQAVAITIGAG
jgi:hypothetical protein